MTLAPFRAAGMDSCATSHIQQFHSRPDIQALNEANGLRLGILGHLAKVTGHPRRLHLLFETVDLRWNGLHSFTRTIPYHSKNSD
jgi:hypothetical protein